MIVSLTQFCYLFIYFHVCRWMDENVAKPPAGPSLSLLLGAQHWQHEWRWSSRGSNISKETFQRCQRRQFEDRGQLRIIGKHANLLVRAVINFRSKGGGHKKFSQGGDRWTKILVLFYSKTRGARWKFWPYVENCYSHGFKSILVCEARPKIFWPSKALKVTT